MKFCAVAGLLCSAAVFVTTLSLAAAGAAGTFRVRDFGAKGDGVTKDTAAVQAKESAPGTMRVSWAVLEICTLQISSCNAIRKQSLKYVKCEFQAFGH